MRRSAPFLRESKLIFIDNLTRFPSSYPTTKLRHFQSNSGCTHTHSILGSTPLLVLGTRTNEGRDLVSHAQVTRTSHMHLDLDCSKADSATRQTPRKKVTRTKRSCAQVHMQEVMGTGHGNR